MWVILGIVSSLFLGIYDILKKSSLKGNAVIPVLFFGSLSSAVIFLFPVMLSLISQEASGSFWYIPPAGLHEHLLIFLKAIIVASSWILAYFALKHLPITIVSPIRASGPFWTLIGAIIIFGEQLNALQWIGLLTTLVSYYLFSIAGGKEGINFAKNKWVFFIILATIIGAVSGLYDKFLIKNINRLTVQAYFSLYMIVVLLPVFFFIWYPRRNKTSPFHWRWTIPLIGAVLTLADFAYFWSLSYEGSLISILSALRRSSVIYAFGFGAILFKEVNIKSKALILLGILAGVILIIFGTS
jgi:transporter family protein